MIIVHIESGLGNQMLSYCEYLALKKINPNNPCYIETVVYDIPDCNEVINQWNGFELDRIFGIKAPNIKDTMPDEQWNRIYKSISGSHFWEKSWNYPKYIVDAFCKNGLIVLNLRGDFEKSKPTNRRSLLSHLRDNFLKNTYIGCELKRYISNRSCQRSLIGENKRNLFLKTSNNIFTGQWLSFKLNGNDIDFIKEEIFNSFVFPPFTSKQNDDMAKLLSQNNSVFIHARRGDMLSANGWCYKYGYFRRAVKLIKEKVDNPLFVFFTDPGSIIWCKENHEIFNLNFKRDRVVFVDWNKGENSFRDMQLMSYCKHGIITNSTFGWWGTYFIKNPNKITISPLVEINTTHHC